MIPESDSPVVVTGHSDVELAGYHTCAREAVLYLVNIEKLSPNDPLVIALAEHLNKRQAHVEYHHLLNAVGENKPSAALRSQLVLAAYKGCDLNCS
jgi:hypothetical protein